MTGRNHRGMAMTEMILVTAVVSIALIIAFRTVAVYLDTHANALELYYAVYFP